MIVTDVTRIDNRRQKVTLDSEYVFSLYNSEIKKYNIETDSKLSREELNYIENEVLYPRAKERVLYLLSRRDRTKKQIEDKLRESYYPEDIILRVIKFACDYGYVNDARYVDSYIKCKSNTKSKKQIECELLKKGIGREMLKSCFENDNDDAQLNAIRNLLGKSKYHSMLGDKSSRNKVIASLIRRGFEYELITRCIGEIEEL